MSLFQGHFASVSKFSKTAPEESSQNKCNQVELPKGGDTRRKFGIKPLKETDLGVAQAFFDP